MDDLLEEFIAETRETLEALSSQLVQWENEPSNMALVDSVFRFVHTVKGSCGFLDLPRLMRLSHAAEDLMSCARQGTVHPSGALVSAVLAIIDRISALTEALESGRAVPDDDNLLIAQMLAFLPAAGGMDPQQLDAIEARDYAVAEIEMDDDASLAAQVQNKSRSVRISLQLLDTLMNGVSDMVLARNEVSRQLRNMPNNAELEHAFTRLSSSVAEMRDAVGLMRMQNIDRLFSSLPRVLRDVGQELNKQIELKIVGGEVEVDREMVEALRDPLTHIIRNAADHGIESAEERIAVGKNPIGNILITARQSGNQILIEISDDGRGINLERLGAKAIGSKQISAATWHQKSERDKLSMIFMPGFSTADKVSSISGRGVGMDIVKTNIQAIGGTIDLENSEGTGLKMILRLPLTLSIIPGLSIGAGNQIFGISRNSVVEILSVSNKNVIIEEIGGMKIASIRGKRMPYAILEDVLEIEHTQSSLEANRTLIVTRPAVGMPFALDVACVIDNEELVVKPGAPLVMETGFFAGTSLPDNGRPMLLLDASGIAAAIGIDNHQQSAEDDDAENKIEILDNKRNSALLFVANEGRKQAIRLSAIDRMEDLSCDQIQFVGGKLRACIDGCLTDIFGLDKAPTEGQVKVLRLTDGTHWKYLAVADVIDIFTLTGDIVPSAHPHLHEGVIQAFGESVELITIFRFFEMAENSLHDATDKPLCYIQTGADDTWERRILEPLLTATGYRVSFDHSDLDNAAIVLGTGDEDSLQNEDSRVLCLRENSVAMASKNPSIYRYDRVGLISAMHEKLVGRR
jgi:two-component system, chemotaxis family, sensor kinase CheA